MRCFDQVYLSMDDKNRNKSYQENKLRELTKTKILNEDDWLKELDTRIKIDNLNNLNIKRVAQLFNKTNQFNLLLEGYRRKRLIPTTHLVGTKLSQLALWINLEILVW